MAAPGPARGAGHDARSTAHGGDPGATTSERAAASTALPRSDTARCLPTGLWQLFAVKNEDQDLSFVSKQVPQVEAFKELANKIVADSFDLDTRDVKFSSLDEAKAGTMGLVGANKDVWDALRGIGLEDAGARQEHMSEGLWLWCPTLAGRSPASDNVIRYRLDPNATDCWDTDSNTEETAQVDKVYAFYVFVWAGKDVAGEAMHPPFNLSLRLLLELTDNVHVVVSAADAAALDERKKPSRAGAGLKRNFVVAREAAASTAVVVGEVTTYEVELPPVYDHVRSTASMTPIGASWHAALQSARSIQSWHVSGTRRAENQIAFSAGAGLAMLGSKQVSFSAAWRHELSAWVAAVNQCVAAPAWRGTFATDAQVARVRDALDSSALSQTLAALVSKDRLKRTHDATHSWEKELHHILESSAALRKSRAEPVPDELVSAMRKSTLNRRLAEDLASMASGLLRVSVDADTLYNAFADITEADTPGTSAPMDVEEAACEVVDRASSGSEQNSWSLVHAMAPPQQDTIDDAETDDEGASLRAPERDSDPEGGADVGALEAPQALSFEALMLSDQCATGMAAAEQFLSELCQRPDDLKQFCRAACEAARLNRGAVDGEIRRAIAAVKVLDCNAYERSSMTAKETTLALDICKVGVETFAASPSKWYPNGSRISKLKHFFHGMTSKSFLKNIHRQSESLHGIDVLLAPHHAHMLREVVASRFLREHAAAVMESAWTRVIAEMKHRDATATAHRIDEKFTAHMSALRGVMEGAFETLDAAVSEHNDTVQREDPAAPAMTIVKIESTSARDTYRATCVTDVPTSGLVQMCTQVQSRSNSGECGGVQLAAQIVEHNLDNWQTMQNVLFLSRTGGRSAQLVRVECDRPGSARPGTNIYVHPVTMEVQAQHRVRSIQHHAAAASYEPSTRVLAVFFPDTPQGPAVSFFVFDAEHTRLTPCRELFIEYHGGTQPVDGHMVLQGQSPWVLLPRPQSSETGNLQDKMALVVTPDKVKLFNCSVGDYEPQKLDIDTRGTQWLATPNCAALLAAHYSPSLQSWQLHSYALEECLPTQPLFAPLGSVELPPGVQQLPQDTRFAAVAVQGSMYLLAASAAHPERVIAAKLHVHSIKMANTLASRDATAHATNVLPWSNKLLNYFHSVCERFPLDDCVNLAMPQAARTPCREVKICLCADKQADAERLCSYVEGVLEHVFDSTEKPRDKVFKLSPVACMDLGEKLAALPAPISTEDTNGSSHAEPFGVWLRRAMCLAPLQISRCAGGTLEAMHDGESRPIEAQDGPTDIIALSERLRLGLYECVLNAHDGPVIVVCALGQQSVGKSYQLNHLGGVFLDVAGGRCTDGVWLTARHFMDEAGVSKLVLFLDCEGIGSLERTETEDMLHCLLAAAVSSFTMFKTHFAFNRELVETLKRLNKGAQKVQSIAGDSEKSMIFQGSIMFCLKDVQGSAMLPTVEEFQARLQHLVQEPQNFVTSMYKNEVAVTAFPPLSRGFYTTLKEDCVPELENCRGYQNGREALEIVKLMLVKMAHKDWTPIDRQWITSRAAALRATMHAACHFGCCGTVRAGALCSDESPLLAAPADMSRDNVTFELGLGSADDVLYVQQVFAANACVLAVSAVPVGADDALQGEEDEAAEGEAGAALALEIVLELDDHKLRLGHLEEIAADGPPVSRVPRTSVEEDLCALKGRLAEMLQLQWPDKDADQFRLLHSVLRAVVAALLKRREERCSAWLQAAITDFRESPEASELQNLLSVHLQRLEAAWAMCGAMCASCHLPCTALGTHTEHSCETDHRCHADCEFCLDEGFAPAAAGCCKDKAGHTGRHMCATRPHACGKECKLSAALNCRGTCRKQPGHDGDCDCESGNHLCGALCDLSGCGGRCTQPYGAAHDRHACGDTSCPERCPLCNRRCPGGHFHALEDPATPHLCGREHACIDPRTQLQRPCASAGVCAISVEIETVEKRTFRGRVDQFEYDHHTMQVVKRDVCVKVVPAGKMTHEGPCCCARKEEEHFCARECPGCEYRCTKPKGHHGRHKMQHGNMMKKVFFSNQDTFDLGGRKYARGDTGEAETCDSACSRLGRGHVHLMHCNAHRVCSSAMHDGVRHLLDNAVQAEAATSQSAATSLCLDECTHDFYWKHVNIEDPCVEDEQRNFRLCGNTCASDEHHNEDGTCDKVHCVLELWHAPLPSQASFQHLLPSGVTDGYISSDGCLFPCKHAIAADVHTFMVIDHSASMGSRTVKPDSADIRQHAHFAGLDNVLGVVYEAALKYMRERSARAPQDLLTFIPFNHRAVVQFSAQPITLVDVLLRSMMRRVKPDGGTAFHEALQTAFHSLEQWRSTGGRQHKPVIITLTDSGDFKQETTLSTLQACMNQEAAVPEEQRVSVHMIGFGTTVDDSYMRQLASIGNGSYLVCRAGTDMDRLDLVKAFSRLAAQPALKASLLQELR